MQRSLRGHYPDQVPRSVAIPPSQPGSPSSRCGILRLSVVSLPARSHGRQLVPLGLVASRVERPNQGRSLWTDTYPDAIIDGDKRNAGVTQLVECLLPKQNVVGSSPITRSE